MDGAGRPDCRRCEEPVVKTWPCFCGLTWDENLTLVDAELLRADADRFLGCQRKASNNDGASWVHAARPTTRLAGVEGRPCPLAPACGGVIVASARRSDGHVFLCCSNNDPKNYHSRPQLCRWSFNDVSDVDPAFAAAVVLRLEQRRRV